MNFLVTTALLLMLVLAPAALAQDTVIQRVETMVEVLVDPAESFSLFCRYIPKLC